MKKNLLPVLILLTALGLHADTKIVEGTMRYRFRVASPNRELLASFYEYRNNSNSQKIIERGDSYIVVENTVNLGPLRTAVPFPAEGLYRSDELRPYLDYSTSRKGIEITRDGGNLLKKEFVETTPLQDDEIDLLRREARAVTAGAEYQHQAVEWIMQHIRSTVSYSLQSSSNPADVLKTGRAYCEGYANVAALLLRSVGIPAKVVDSYIPPGHMWGYGQEGSGGFHAHIEVFYQDAGWISYDPQATVHFVDPFHIVNYPRERTTLTQLEVSDERAITDVLAEPRNWDNFFQRDTTTGRNFPVLVGKIIRSDGTRVEDSFRSNEWVYLRQSDGSGEGIRILANGEFVLSPVLSPAGDEPVTFFYRDGQGGWIEEEVDFEFTGRLEKTFRLDDPSSTIQLHTAGSDFLYLWYREAGGGWRLDRISAGPDKTLRLISSGGKWIVSENRMDISPKYLLDTGRLEAGRQYKLSELPRYLDPESYYLRISLGSGADGTDGSADAGAFDGAASSPADQAAQTGQAAQTSPGTLQFLDIDRARRYPPVELDQNPALLQVPDPDVSTVVIKTEGRLTVKNLPRPLRKGAMVELERSASVRRIEIAAGNPTSPLVLAFRDGRRFNEIARSSPDPDGTLLLELESAILQDPEREYYLLYGNPLGSKRLLISDIPAGRIELE